MTGATDCAPLQGHTDEMWGLAAHPWKPHFLTCGYDRHVCLWDSSTHQLIWAKSMEVGMVNGALWRQLMGEGGMQILTF